MPGTQRAGSRLAKLFSKLDGVSLAFALLLSASIVIGNRIVVGTWVGLPVTKNFVTPFRLTDLIALVVLTGVFSVAVSWLPEALRTLRERAWTAQPLPSRRQAVWRFAILMAVISLAWLPFLLTYAPGVVAGDSMRSIGMALGWFPRWSNHHPVLYTLLIKLALVIGMKLHSINAGVFIYTVVQYLIMAASYAYTVMWLARRGAPRYYTILVTAYFALVPVFPMYSVTMWKDPLFGTFIMLYAMLIFDAVASEGALLRAGKGVAGFVVLSILIIFFRNNGILVVIAAGFALALAFRSSLKLFYVAFLATVGIALTITGPVFDRLDVEKPFVEAVGIPLQQMGYVLVTDGDIAPEEERFLYALLPEKVWREVYAPSLVDRVKWHEEFNVEYLEENQRTFVRTWLEMLTRNPEAYLKSYALMTVGYWKIGAKNSYEYMKTETYENDAGVREIDLIERATGFSLKPTFDWLRGPDGTNGYVSSGLIVWLTFLCATVMIQTRRARYLSVLAPCIGAWLSLMIASPVAFGLRYLFMIVASLPLILALPLLAPDDGAEPDPAAS